MADKPRRWLIIDTTVARASGPPESEAIVGAACRDLLQAVMEVCHGVDLPAEIKEEWKKHQSNFARQWRTQMARKGKLRITDPPQHQPLRDACAALVAAEVGETKAVKLREDLWKDRPLLEGALAGDRLVVSLDDSMRESACKLSRSVPDLRRVQWANPCPEKIPANLRPWLDADCAESAEHLLTPTA